MMRKKKVFMFLILLSLFFISGLIVQKQNSTSGTNLNVIQNEQQREETGENENFTSADTVKIGAYIISIFDLNFPDNKVNVDFYLWYNTSRDSMELIDNFEIINAIDYHKSHETVEKRGGLYYHNLRVHSVIKKNWDIANFPFDKQTIAIHIEDYNKDLSMLVFSPDTAASKIDDHVSIGGWKITDFNIKVKEHVYETNYGDPEIPVGEYSSYSRAILFITIEREGNGLFFKLFLGLFISVLISLITFFIDPVDLDPRFGLSVGAIFAAIASQYVITSTLPQNERITLVDILHDISFIFIFLCIVGSVISLHLKKQNKIQQHKKLDKTGFIVLSVCYMILVIIFVSKSI